MKFQLKDLKSKKAIVIIIIVVAIIIGFMFYRNYKAQDFLKDLKVEYAGYSDNGMAVVTDDGSLSSFKKVAKYEAKKAHFDSSAAKTIINSADTVDDLSSGEVFDSMKMKDPADAEIYAHHMVRTRIELSKSAGLKNGDKITASITDNSVDPYFETKTKEFTVSGIKKTNVYSVQSFKKYLSITGSGTNHHSRVNVKISKNSKPSVRVTLGRLDDAFKINSDNAYSNGDEFSASEKSIAKVLNQAVNYRRGYKFVGRPNQKVTIAVTGLKDGRRTAKNLQAISQYGIKEYNEANEDDPKDLSLVGSTYDPDEEELTLVYKAGSNDYYVSIISDVQYKNHTLVSKDKPLEDYDDLFDYNSAFPEQNSDLTDKNWNNREDTSDKTIDFVI